jgi:hypothetical protein
MFATTREVYAEQKVNAALDRLDRDLKNARPAWGSDQKVGRARDAMVWFGLALAVAAADLEKAEQFAAAGQAVSS